MARLVYTAKVIENSATVLLARITDIYGAPIQVADILSMTLRVYNNATGTLIVPDGQDEETYTGTNLDVDAIALDTPATDIRWTYGDPDDIPGTGYNAVIELDGSYIPEGGTVYRVELEIIPQSDEYLNLIGLTYYCLWELTTTNIWSA